MVLSARSRRLPVTVVTGFLGAGKTSLLRHLLLSSGQRLAVLVNEFGELGIDGDLLRSCGFCPEEELEGRLVELANGCLCCTVQEEFIPTMEQLLARADQLDGILVETSGLALPEPLIAAFGWPAIRHRTRVQGIVAVVDGEALAAGAVVADPVAVERQRRLDATLEHASGIDELFEEQLELADLVVVSRADRIDTDGLDRVKLRIAAATRPGTPVVAVERGVIDPDLALGLSASGMERAPSDPAHQAEDDHHPDHDHVHVAMESMAFEAEGAFARPQLEQLLQELIREGGLVRVKGRLWQEGKTLPLQIQAVGPRLECWYEGQPGTAHPPALELVLLGFQLNRSDIEQRLLALDAPESS
ncbi:MAG: cobalamin biosynthesis protein CobW [Cyanobacteriota bacterium]|nr:cobalamin biosynthesis protein CobW [Cyanobacteriota bacterium]